MVTELIVCLTLDGILDSLEFGLSNPLALETNPKEHEQPHIILNFQKGSIPHIMEKHPSTS